MDIKEYQRNYYQTHKEQLNEKKRKWKKAHPEKVKEYIKRTKPENYSKEYYRKHTLRVNGKAIHGLNKRAYPEDNKCELCNKEPKKFLIYHHWDPQNLSKGIFVC